MTSKESGKPSRALSRYKTRFSELFRARYRVVKPSSMNFRTRYRAGKLLEVKA